MPTPPPAAVLDAVGAVGAPHALTGGRRTVWRVGDLVLKPLDTTTAMLELQADVLGAVAGDAGVRVAPPVRAASGGFVVDGWTASPLLPGRAVRGDWASVMAAGRALHDALEDVGRPAALDDRDDVWARADRLVWDLSATAPHPSLSAAFAARRPVDLPDQLVHGDLTGNVLIDDDGTPGVVDLSPYWRPSAWATAVVGVDAMLYSAADPATVDAAAMAGAGAIPSGQVLLRAGLFRLTTAALLGREPSRERRGLRTLRLLTHRALAEP